MLESWLIAWWVLLLAMAWWPCCCGGADNCKNCQSGTESTSYSIVIPELTDNDCSTCADIAGTYVVPYWTKNVNGCYFRKAFSDPSGCCTSTLNVELYIRDNPMGGGVEVSVYISCDQWSVAFGWWRVVLGADLPYPPLIDCDFSSQSLSDYSFGGDECLNAGTTVSVTAI